MGIKYLDEPQGKIRYLDEKTSVTDILGTMKRGMPTMGQIAGGVAGSVGGLTGSALFGTLGRGLGKRYQMRPELMLTDILKAQGLQTGPMGELSPEQMKTAMGASGEAVVPEIIGAGLGGMATKAFPMVGRKLAGMTKEAAEWVSKRGGKTVFDPIKMKVDYIKTTLLPHAKQIFDKNTKQALAAEGKEMGKSLEKISGNTIQFPKTFSAIKSTLKKYGLIDETGFLREGALTDVDTPSAVRVLGKLYQETLSGRMTKGATVSATPAIEKSRFLFYRNMLRRSQRSAGEFSGDVQKVVDGLYADAEKAGAIGLRAIKDRYRNIINTIEEVNISEGGLPAKLESAVNPKNWVYLKERMRPIFKDKTNEIFNSIKDHSVAVSSMGKEGYLTRGSLVRDIAQGIYRGGSQAIDYIPKIAQEAISGAATGTGRGLVTYLTDILRSK